jgi:hypothetical protein
MSSLGRHHSVAGHPADHRRAAMLGSVRSVAVRDGLVNLVRAFTTREPNWLHRDIYIVDGDRLTGGIGID